MIVPDIFHANKQRPHYYNSNIIIKKKTLKENKKPKWPLISKLRTHTQILHLVFIHAREE